MTLYQSFVLVMVLAVIGACTIIFLALCGVLVLFDKIDQIILTGGIAYNAKTQEDMKAAVEWIAPVTIYPGEDELLALAQGALRVVTGEEEAMVY